MPDWKKAARRAAQRYGVDPDVFIRQLTQESGGNPDARSPAGAQGIAQFIPSTAKQYGVNLNDGRISDDLDGAARFMRDNLKQFGGDYRKALAAYNAGAGAVQKYGGVPPYAETQAYVKRILAGQNPKSSRPASGGSSQGGDTITTRTTTTSPGVDNSALRKQLLQQYLLQRGRPDALLSLGRGLQGAQDVPASSSTTSSSRPAFTPGYSLVVGDSIAVGVAPKLGVRSDAKVGRSTAAGVQRLAALNPNGNILVSLGANDDRGNTGAFRQQVRRALEAAPNATLTWATIANAPALNKVLREEAARSNGRLRVVDWTKKVRTSDGVHPSDYGALARLLSGGGGSSSSQRPVKTGARRKPGELKELFYDPLGGIKHGKRIGAIGGHGDHVHVAAGPRQVDDIGRLAQRMGLRVSENETFDPVDPVHTTNSYHYSDRAIDVSGDAKRMAEFTRRVARRYGVKL